MIRTYAVEKVLGGVDFETIIPTHIKTYAQLQIKSPVGGLLYTVNDLPTGSSISVTAGDFIQHPILPAPVNEACDDIVKIKGAGTVAIEIAYYIN